VLQREYVRRRAAKKLKEKKEKKQEEKNLHVATLFENQESKNLCFSFGGGGAL
jgi:hypothetical protein